MSVPIYPRWFVHFQVSSLSNLALSLLWCYLPTIHNTKKGGSISRADIRYGKFTVVPIRLWADTVSTCCLCPAPDDSQIAIKRRIAQLREKTVSNHWLSRRRHSYPSRCHEPGSSLSHNLVVIRVAVRNMIEVSNLDTLLNKGAQHRLNLSHY